MISLEKLRIKTPLRKLPKNVRHLGKIIVAKGLKKLPKEQKIAQSDHTGSLPTYLFESALNPFTQVRAVVVNVFCLLFQ